MNAEQAFQQALALSKKYTAETMQGSGAIKGDPGENGVSPTVSVADISGGHKVTITDASGAHSFDVMDGNADIAGGTIGMFTLSKDANIQKDSVLNVPKSQIVGHTPIKYPGQVYDIYAGIICQGKEIYFTSFIIQKETGEANQYYEIKIMDEPKKLTGSSSSNDGLPVGSIIIWSGTADNIPSGWHICDGTDNTPDLTDKFVLGAGTTHNVGDTGGEETHTLTVEEMPEHNHNMLGWTESNKGYPNTQPTVQKGGDGSETVHTLWEGGDQPHNNMPPYYTLCYIMKVS